MINKMILQFKENKWIHYVLIIIIGIILSISLNQIQIRDTHDGSLHMLRLIGTMDTLKMGQFPPLINQNYCNGFGYSMNLFYQPLVTYFPLLIKLIVPTYMLALKVFGAICIILSGITMYQFVYQTTKKRGIAFFSAIFYLIAPYKLANVYKRFAIGEFTAMVFIPLVFLGLVNLFEQDRKKHYYIAIGAIGLMLSHTVTTLYTALFCILYSLFHLKELKEKEIIKKCILNGIFIVLITMFFWMPLLQASTLADYAIMNNDTMGTNGDFAAENTISFSQLWKDKGEEDGTTFLLGIPTIIVLLTTFFVVHKVEGKYKDFYLLSIIFSLIALFMVSRFFPWKIMPNLLCKLQYPWRMMGFFNFFTSFICGINLYYLLKYMVKKDKIKMVFVLIFVSLCIWNSMNILSQFYTTEKEIDEKYETSILENRKISHKRINRDYMPMKALKLQNTYVMTREDKTYLLEGNATILEEIKKDLKDTIQVENVQRNTQLEFPYFYYPGYEVSVITEENKEKIKPIESKNGYLACNIDNEITNATIVVEYVGTKLTYISYGISFISLFIFIVYFTYEKRKEKKND